MSEKRLVDLNPSWFVLEGMNEDKPVALQFDCPTCLIWKPFIPHRFFVPFVDNVWNSPRLVWQKKGETFEDVSMFPSIFVKSSDCEFHGWITKGLVTWE